MTKCNDILSKVKFFIGNYLNPNKAGYIYDISIESFLTQLVITVSHYCDALCLLY